MVSGNNGFRSSVGTGASDIKTKRLFVTGNRTTYALHAVSAYVFIHLPFNNG
jgi:hypothetical protein